MRKDVAVNRQTQSCTAPEGLAAGGPHPDFADKLMLFGQFVGDWDVDFVVYGPDGSKQKERAEWHFGWVLDGRAIQDVFIIPRRSEREKSNWARYDYGTCLRFYDPSIDCWRVVWVSPINGEILTFTARQVDEEIVLKGKDVDGTPMRWIFSNITQDSFHWRRVLSTDGGLNWQLHKEMVARRMGRSDDKVETNIES
jgi:hypothetical protein